MNSSENISALPATVHRAELRACIATTRLTSPGEAAPALAGLTEDEYIDGSMAGEAKAVAEWGSAADRGSTSAPRAVGLALRIGNVRVLEGEDMRRDFPR
mmetsp:Transcript_33399/g.66233  ORF Transcript_33399/g.66233 Transcript_33399/m.66233 type:complete len:100 (-) Transcript_33399:965-1264(-)